MKSKKQAKLIIELRTLIPSFKCQGCHGCCGPVPFSYWERLQAEKIAGIRYLSKDMKCPYVDRVKGCLIYEERPIICRLFGAVENKEERVSMSCLNSHCPDIKLADIQGSAIMNKYILTNPGLLRFDEELEKLCKTNNKKLVSESIHKGF